MQDNLIVAPKTQSGRPNQKKLATQALAERVSKGSPSTGLGFNGASQNNIKKSAKHSLGLPGRNRTATALLVASASASSEPLQEEDRPSHAIRNFAQPDHQLLNNEFENGKRLLVSQNIIDRKTRLKTSQGTKSNGVVSGQQSKLPLMQTLDHQNNQITFMKGKDRGAQANSLSQNKSTAISRGNHKNRPIDN